MEKYLRQYAERGTDAVEELPASEPWQQVVVIPVCNEQGSILRALPPSSGRILMILVVNETELASQAVSAANRVFAEEVHGRFTKLQGPDEALGLKLYSDETTPRDILLVDRYSSGHRFSPKGGVGHARKTGCDMAAHLINQGRVNSPWIHCTDADVRMPQRYFTASAAINGTAAQNVSALVYPFRHGLAMDSAQSKIQGFQQQKIMQVTRLYEYSLRYYVAGLNYAHSPYAFHTIGSTIAINASHYAKVRGIPRRQAGEDFYLLNKLAKVGAVRQLNAESECGPIDIAARLSDRVPFGTGAAVGTMMEFEDPAREFHLYHPSVFDFLRGWLDSLPTFWQTQSSDIAAILTSMDLQVLISGLEQAGAQQALQHALRQSSDSAQFMRQMHTWFDAFRTLKLIHHLREHHVPSISFASLMNEPNLDHLLEKEPMLLSLHGALRKGERA